MKCFKFLFLIIIIITTSQTFAQNSTAHKQVQVYSQLLGKGSEAALKAAVQNSEKGVLIALVYTDEKKKLLNLVTDVLNENIINGRERVFIIVGDKPENARNKVLLFANGELVGAFAQNSDSVGSGLALTNVVSKAYDKHIKPLLAAK